MNEAWEALEQWLKVDKCRGYRIERGNVPQPGNGPLVILSDFNKSIQSDYEEDATYDEVKKRFTHWPTVDELIHIAIKRWNETHPDFPQ